MTFLFKQVLKEFLEERNLLQEGISKIVYHFTNLDSLSSILKSDKFMTSVAYGTSSDNKINKSRFYYFSTMRTPQGYYGSGVDVEQVLLILDGQKLGTKYKGSPVDYWGPEYRKENPKMAETEDRIFTDKAWIPEATKYILGVRIAFNPNTSFGVRQEAINELSFINDELTKRNIPISIHTTEKSFRTIASKGISFEQFAKEVKDSVKPIDQDQEDYKKRFPKKPNSALEVVVKLLNSIKNNMSYSDLSDEQKKILRSLSGMDGAALLSSWVHNSKSKSIDRNSIEFIGNAIKYLKLKDIKQLVEYIKNYFK